MSFFQSISAGDFFNENNRSGIYLPRGQRSGISIEATLVEVEEVWKSNMRLENESYFGILTVGNISVLTVKEEITLDKKNEGICERARRRPGRHWPLRATALRPLWGMVLRLPTKNLQPTYEPYYESTNTNRATNILIAHFWRCCL